jgi:hypothetical protein
MTEEALAEETASTVEWGSPVAARSRRWTSRFDLRIPRTALGLASGAGAFALALAAQIMPWATLPIVSPAIFDNGSGPGPAQFQAVGLEVLGSSPLVFVYDAVWPVLFAVFAAAFVVGRRRRRALAATGLGLAAGQLLVLAGLYRAVHHVSSNFGVTGTALVRLELEATSTGQGVYLSVGAVVLAALGLALVSVPPGRRRLAPVPEEFDDDLDGELPPDLTVTAVESAEWGRPRDIDVRSDGAGG